MRFFIRIGILGIVGMIAGVYMMCTGEFKQGATFLCGGFLAAVAGFGMMKFFAED